MFFEKPRKTRCFCSPGRSRPRKIRGFCGSATERSQSAPRTSPEHPSAENTVFYDGFNASECRNIVFCVFLSVLGASPGRPQSIPAVKTQYFTMVFMPRYTKTPYFTCFCASPERSQGVSRASQSSKHHILRWFSRLGIQKPRISRASACSRMPPQRLQGAARASRASQSVPECPQSIPKRPQSVHKASPKRPRGPQGVS